MNILKQKSENSYPKELMNTFKLIAFSPNFDIAGSANLKSILYPSDYDLFNEEIEHDNKNDALYYIVIKFQNMIKIIKKHKQIFFIEFKCGIDFNSFFDKFDNKKLFLEYLKNLLNLKYINLQEYNKAKLLNTVDEIKEFARSYYILRWNQNDILKGYIILKNGTKQYLINSILNDSIIKLDIILHYNYSIFIEMSSMFLFKIGNKWSSDIKKSTIEKSILNEYKNYLNHGNIYKALKRAFVIYRFNKNIKKCTELTKYFNSNIWYLE